MLFQVILDHDHFFCPEDSAENEPTRVRDSTSRDIDTPFNLQIHALHKPLTHPIKPLDEALRTSQILRTGTSLTVRITNETAPTDYLPAAGVLTCYCAKPTAKLPPSGHGGVRSAVAFLLKHQKTKACDMSPSPPNSELCADVF